MDIRVTTYALAPVFALTEMGADAVAEIDDSVLDEPLEEEDALAE